MYIIGEIRPKVIFPNFPNAQLYVLHEEEAEKRSFVNTYLVSNSIFEFKSSMVVSYGSITLLTSDPRARMVLEAKPRGALGDIAQPSSSIGFKKSYFLTKCCIFQSHCVCYGISAPVNVFWSVSRLLNAKISPEGCIATCDLN